MIQFAGVQSMAPTSHATPTFAAANYRYTAWMSSDTLELWNANQSVLWRTLDYWATDTEIRTFDRGVAGVRQLVSGELLVSIYGDADNPGELWRTTGYTRANPTAATWTKVLTCSNDDATITGDWLMWCAADVLMVGEYGSKLAGANARRVMLSLDDGLTWTQVYDWAGEGRHLHGCAHDRYADMLWINFGDTSQGYAYSTDWRTKLAAGQSPTWVEHITTLNTGTTSAVQPVGVYPMRDRVVMGTDDTWNGLYRIERDDYDTPILAFSAFPHGEMKTIATMPYRHQDDDDAPLLWPWMPLPGNTGTTGLAATMDGLTWHVLWADAARGYTGSGLYRCVGPDSLGRLHGYSGDAAEASGTRVVLAAPSWADAVI